MKIREYYDKSGEFHESIVLDKEEQKTWYNHCVKMILENPGYILENLDFLPEFRVNWEDYHKPGYWKEYYRKKAKKPKAL